MSITRKLLLTILLTGLVPLLLSSFLLFSLAKQALDLSRESVSSPLVQAQIDARIDAFQKTAVLMIVLMIVFIVAHAIVVARSVAEPMRKLTDVTNAISRGKLDVTLDPHLMTQQDETGDLARSFDRILVSLKLAMRETGKKPPKKKV
jgi:nitrogen fixation/metabolism regulation signal transduction histidine kinase